MINKTPRCPLCNNRLYLKKCGLVCKNFKCSLYWKLGGWYLKDSDYSLWQYTNNDIDKGIAWDIRHGYPPRKEKINERHINAMYEALRVDENLCFIIPLRYYSPDSEVVPE